MALPTEPVGSLPRPAKLQAALANYHAHKVNKEELKAEQDAACPDSILRTLAGAGLAENLPADGRYFVIFTDGHHRQLPRLTGRLGPPI